MKKQTNLRFLDERERHKLLAFLLQTSHEIRKHHKPHQLAPSALQVCSTKYFKN